MNEEQGEELELQYKVVFSLECDPNTLTYSVGTFVCTAWPVLYQVIKDEEAFDALKKLMPDEMAVELERALQALHFTRLRARMDNKAGQPCVLTVPGPVDRAWMERYLAALPVEKQTKLFRGGC